MKKGEKRSLQAEHRKRLKELGLPADLFSEGFWEREAVAKQRELALLAEFERWRQSGEWDHLPVPFERIVARWRAELANPPHFASIGPNPRWVPILSDAACNWRRHRNGSYRKSWRDHRRKEIAKKREAQGKPPPKFRKERQATLMVPILLIN